MISLIGLTENVFEFGIAHCFVIFIFVPYLILFKYGCDAISGTDNFLSC